MVAARKLSLVLLAVMPLVMAQDSTTSSTPSTPSTPVTYPTTTPLTYPSTNPTPVTSPASCPTPGSDWSLSKEQLDLVNRRIRSAAKEEEHPATTQPSIDYEEKPEEPDEPSAVSGEHLPTDRHTPNRPVGWTASQEVLDASYPARRRRQVVVRRRRQLPLAPPTSTSRRVGQSPGKGQGEYHGTVLGAVFIKPKPITSTGSPAKALVGRSQTSGKL